MLVLVILFYRLLLLGVFKHHFLLVENVAAANLDGYLPRLVVDLRVVCLLGCP